MKVFIFNLPAELSILFSLTLFQDLRECDDLQESFFDILNGIDLL